MIDEESGQSVEPMEEVPLKELSKSELERWFAAVRHITLSKINTFTIR